MKGRVAWVIGGTSGIGEAVAQTLYANDREVFSTGEKEADVRDWDTLGDQMEHILELNGGRLDEVIYSAGVNELQWLGKMGQAHDFLRLLDVNVAGFVRTMDLLANAGLSNLRIAAIGSDAAERPLRTSALYCASKAALHMAARVTAREKADVGWRVNVVAPGMTADTKMTEYIDARVPGLRGWTSEEAMAYEQQQGVVKRRADRYEIANVVLDVLEGPDYLNGSVITVNGGR